MRPKVAGGDEAAYLLTGNLFFNTICPVTAGSLLAAHGVLRGPIERSVVGPARARLVAGVRGRVLEVGAGTGANLAWYPPGVDRVDLCEPDPLRRRRLERRVAAGSWPFPVAVHAAAPEGPFPSASYDTVVSTFVLCSAPDPEVTASALRRALADGGRGAYLEHVGAGGPTGRVQARLSPRWERLAGGCHLDRPPSAALRSAGLVPIEQRWLRLPPPLVLAVAGQAIVRVRPARTGPG